MTPDEESPPPIDQLMEALASSAAEAESRGPALLGVRIRDARKDRGLRQQDLAEKLGVGRYTVIRWEAGEHVPSRGQRQKLAQVLGGDPADYTPAYVEAISDRQLVTEAGMTRSNEVEQLRRKVAQLDARVRELELREAARRVLEARSDPLRRDAILDEALALAEAIVHGTQPIGKPQRKGGA